MKKTLSNGQLRVACLMLIAVFSFVFTAWGQTAREEAQKLQRPKDCGVRDYDDFKNASFNLLGEILKTDLNYDKLKTDIQGYLSGEKEASISGANTDINKMRAILKSIKVMDDRVKKLTTEGNELMQNAANIKPITAAKQATSNTKTSLKAVDASKNLMEELSGTVTKDIQTLSEKIQEMGGTVEEEKEGIEEPK
jgi:hypothetical protein